MHRPLSTHVLYGQTYFIDLSSHSTVVVGKGVCEVVTWSSVMNAVVVAVVDEYPDNMSVYHSDCMCNSGWCVGSSTVQYPLHISMLAARNGNRTFGNDVH